MKQHMKEMAGSGRFPALLATVACAAYGFAAMCVRVRDVFNEPIEDMSHGWLVLPFSLYVLWTQRAKMRESVGEPSAWGLAASVPCALLAIFGTRGLQLRFEQLGFIGLCMTIPWAFYGRRFARHFVFPAIFLLFTIPLSTFLDMVTIHLRLLASGTALFVLKGFGLDVVQRGTAVISQGPNPFSVDVAAPCSGMRSIFALMALTAAYAWFTQPTWLRRGALFACSVPLAVLGNVTRILTICLVAAGTNQKFALGFYHDYSGYIVFIVAIVMMVVCGGLIDRLFASKPAPSKPASGLQPNRGRLPQPHAEGGEGQGCDVAANQSVNQSTGQSTNKPLIPWLGAVILGGLFMFQGMTPRSIVTEPPNFALPASMDGYKVDEVLYCQNEQCSATFSKSNLERGREGVCPGCGGVLEGSSLGERTILPGDTRIVKRLYSTGAAQFLVSAVIGGTSKSSIHRPELCMPAQGYQMRDPVDLRVADGREFRSIRLESPRAPSTVLSYTFFNQAGARTSSHTRRILVDVWDRSVLNRIDRWVMVTVAASGEGGFSLSDGVQRAALERFLETLSESLP